MVVLGPDYRILAANTAYQRQFGTVGQPCIGHLCFRVSHHHDVPFHQMARLGGYGDYPDLSRTLRAYHANRFYDNVSVLFNLEYRYTVYEYRDFKLDTLFSWDEGQVFKKFSTFQFKDFRDSYGGGFRFSILNHTLLSIEIAHGDEGTTFYVKGNAPF